LFADTLADIDGFVSLPLEEQLRFCKLMGKALPLPVGQVDMLLECAAVSAVGSSCDVLAPAGGGVDTDGGDGGGDGDAAHGDDDDLYIGDSDGGTADESSDYDDGAAKKKASKSKVVTKKAKKPSASASAGAAPVAVAGFRLGRPPRMGRHGWVTAAPALNPAANVSYAAMYVPSLDTAACADVSDVAIAAMAQAGETPYSPNKLRGQGGAAAAGAGARKRAGGRARATEDDASVVEVLDTLVEADATVDEVEDGAAVVPAAAVAASARATRSSRADAPAAAPVPGVPAVARARPRRTVGRPQRYLDDAFESDVAEETATPAEAEASAPAPKRRRVTKPAAAAQLVASGGGGDDDGTDDGESSGPTVEDASDSDFNADDEVEARFVEALARKRGASAVGRKRKRAFTRW